MCRKENSTLFYCFTPPFNSEDFDEYENYELAKKFHEDQINQRVMFVSLEDSVKLASMYQEKRFTKLGATTACVVKSIDLYNKLL